MKKHIVVIGAIFLLGACSNREHESGQPEHKEISAFGKVQSAYKPGFGALMANMQYHHAKLWHAGNNKNWKLADFALFELGEAREDIDKYNAHRKEAKQIVMMDSTIATVKLAIHEQDIDKFRSAYSELTNTCNTCHKVTGYEFISIVTPSAVPVVNQDFKPF